MTSVSSRRQPVRVWLVLWNLGGTKVEGIVVTPAHQKSRAELSASVLQAFLRARAGTGVRPTGRRCSSGRHFRSICLFVLPWGRRSGSGEKELAAASHGDGLLDPRVWFLGCTLWARLAPKGSPWLELCGVRATSAAGGW